MSNSQSRRSALSRAANGISMIVSLGGMVFLGPRVWPLIEAPIQNALIDLYSPGVAHWLAWLGWVASYPLTYFAIRLALSLTVMAALFHAERRRM